MFVKFMRTMNTIYVQVAKLLTAYFITLKFVLTFSTPDNIFK
jgi:hypothetical protein